MIGETTRERIVAAADELFYRQGFDRTSFADIADAVGLSRGNFYYHFKTKDQILDAVIEARLEKTGRVMTAWENEAGNPTERIRLFIRILITNQAKIMRYGCPVGTLTNELAKIDHAAKDDASGIFSLFRDWLCRQFALLGHGRNADDLAMHLLARSQGVATLATAFQDEAFVEREVAAMCDWLESCAAAAAGKDIIN